MLLASSFADALEILQQYGPFCGCLILAIAFFMFRDMRREDRLTARVTLLETEFREALIPIVKNCTEVIVKNTVVMERNASVMERIERKLDNASV